MIPRHWLPPLLSLFAGLGLQAAEPIPQGWFLWPSQEPREGSPLDLRDMNAKPAGAEGFVSVKEGRFYTQAGTRLRFWGCNLSSGENFPDVEGARRLARRLAQGGINIARLHHLDNPWSVDSRGSLWTPGQPGRIHIDEVQLDKLHRLVAELKAQGIYSNINLKVSRTHNPEDGFPPSVLQCPPFQKRVDYFQARMIELQKDYARQLLTRKNPYTGLSLAEDPAVAMVEINNENSLLGLRSRDVGAGLELLPEPFKGELEVLWTQWLRNHYKDQPSLAAAWAKGATPVGRELVTQDSGWHAEAQPGNQLTLEAAKDLRSLRIRLESSDGVRWRSAAYLDHLALRDGETNTLRFRIRADKPRAVQVAVSRDEPSWRTDKWRTRGLSRTLNIGTEWSEHRLVFNAHSVVEKGSRLTFMVGHALGEVQIEGLSLQAGSASAGLQPGEALAGRIGVPEDATPVQWVDWLRFLSDTETAYVEQLRSYLRNELGVKVPLVCTQANYGGIAGLVRERSMDFIDSHYYWQHPDFAGPTGVWNPAGYIVLNTPQLGEFSPRWFGELGGIALLRVKGKPFTVTEVDHAAPSEYACEMYPVLATFAALQDWDGLFPFDAVEIGVEPESNHIGTFFDQRHHPAKWGFSAFATRVFRQGLVPPLSSGRTLSVHADFWADTRHLDVLWLRQVQVGGLGFLEHRLSVMEQLLPAGDKPRVEDSGPAGAGAARLVRAEAGPVWVVEAPQAAALVGYCGGGTLNAGPLRVSCDRFGLDFAAVTALSLDARPLGESSHLLITLAARAGTPDMRWNPERTSVGEIWGRGPVIAERVPARVSLSGAAALRVYPLAPDGSRLPALPAREVDGRLEFSTGEGPATLHYELAPAE